MTRNPYRPEQVLKYRLDPEVVDVLCFCTKNQSQCCPVCPRSELFGSFGLLH